jgi:hypothetical protein
MDAAMMPNGARSSRAVQQGSTCERHGSDIADLAREAARFAPRTSHFRVHAGCAQVSNARRTASTPRYRASTATWMPTRRAEAHQARGVELLRHPACEFSVPVSPSTAVSQAYLQAVGSRDRTERAPEPRTERALGSLVGRATAAICQTVAGAARGRRGLEALRSGRQRAVLVERPLCYCRGRLDTRMLSALEPGDRRANGRGGAACSMQHAACSMQHAVRHPPERGAPSPRSAALSAGLRAGRPALATLSGGGGGVLEHGAPRLARPAWHQRDLLPCLRERGVGVARL